MIPVTIQKQIEIAAKAATVWRFVGTEEGLRQWWGMAIALEAKPGGRCEEEIQWQGRRYTLRGQVTAYQPPHTLALFLQNVDETANGPALTTISITLTEREGRTQVTLVQQAWRAMTAEPALEPQGATLPPFADRPSVGKRTQPQNWLNRGIMHDPQPALASGFAHPRLDDRWLAQEETRWQERLQTLAQQVGAAPDRV